MICKSQVIPTFRLIHNVFECQNLELITGLYEYKKDPIASLAREICQNSIDASYGEKPVKVEFSLFVQYLRFSNLLSSLIPFIWSTCKSET